MDFHAFLDELEKIAVTRSVQEWRKATAGGDTAGADAIAQAHGALGAKPRYLEDISLGGAEAGVDKMMGSAGAQAGPAPSLQQRFQQYQQNKAQLGIDAGRTPTQSVKSSPEGRAALLRGTEGPAQAAAPNESGYIARKLYKPDSSISRGEYTPQLLEQKQRLTDEARALSPEAKAMVPAMYGHQTMGSGPTQRTISHHEYVPGISDLRGTNTGTAEAPQWSRSAGAATDRAALQQHVLNPMAARGHTMADTISSQGANYGNIVNTQAGPKILDFLPNVQGEKNPAIESFKKYVPNSGSAFDTGSVGDLRKEIFNPKMQVQPASADMQHRADVALSGQQTGPRTPAPAASPNSNLPTRPNRPTPNADMPTAPVGRAPANGLAHAPTAPSAQNMLGHAPTVASAQGALAHAPTLPSAVTAAKPMASAANVASHLPTVRPGAIAGAAGKLENAAMKTAPGFLRKATTAISHI